MAPLCSETHYFQRLAPRKDAPSKAQAQHSSSLRAHMCTAAHHDECQPAPGTENKVRKSCLNCMIYMTQVWIYKRPRGNKASNTLVMSVI